MHRPCTRKTRQRKQNQRKNEEQKTTKPKYVRKLIVADDELANNVAKRASEIILFGVLHVQPGIIFFAGSVEVARASAQNLHFFAGHWPQQQFYYYLLSNIIATFRLPRTTYYTATMIKVADGRRELDYTLTYYILNFRISQMCIYTYRS